MFLNQELKILDTDRKWTAGTNSRIDRLTHEIKGNSTRLDEVTKEIDKLKVSIEVLKN